eukprot:TRINITY_DN3981_c0_g1_i7.p1 TRINITY_DN3981_c0_g1~~TRINITY_DN3981_c0_g1_i7.p1  ORF type:complete len:659 (+),score=161.08 TRINITY_DN3981_c0_g1_i7:1385-3361(+)
MIIAVAKETGLLLELLEQIYADDHTFVIHLDSRDGPQGVAAASSTIKASYPRDNLKVISTRQIMWGGFSMILAEMDLLTELFRIGGSFKRVINLSATAYPIKKPLEIRRFLGSFGNTNHFETHVTTESKNRKRGTRHWFLECTDARHVYKLPGIKPTMSGVQNFGGSQWFVLTRPFAQQVVKCLNGKSVGDEEECTYIRDMFEYFRYSLIPDESFFQSVAMASPWCSTVAPRGLTFISWEKKTAEQQHENNCLHKDLVDWCGNSPGFIMGNMTNLMFDSYQLFARKFSASSNQSLASKHMLKRLLQDPAVPTHHPVPYGQVAKLLKPHFLRQNNSYGELLQVPYSRAPALQRKFYKFKQELRTHMIVLTASTRLMSLVRNWICAIKQVTFRGKVAVLIAAISPKMCWHLRGFLGLEGNVRVECVEAPLDSISTPPNQATEQLLKLESNARILNSATDIKWFLFADPEVVLTKDPFHLLGQLQKAASNPATFSKLAFVFSSRRDDDKCDSDPIPSTGLFFARGCTAAASTLGNAVWALQENEHVEGIKGAMHDALQDKMMAGKYQFVPCDLFLNGFRFWRAGPKSTGRLNQNAVAVHANFIRRPTDKEACLRMKGLWYFNAEKEQCQNGSNPVDYKIISTGTFFRCSLKVAPIAPDDMR